MKHTSEQVVIFDRDVQVSLFTAGDISYLTYDLTKGSCIWMAPHWGMIVTNKEQESIPDLISADHIEGLLNIIEPYFLTPQQRVMIQHAQDHAKHLRQPVPRSPETSTSD